MGKGMRLHELLDTRPLFHNTAIVLTSTHLDTFLEPKASVMILLSQACYREIEI